MALQVVREASQESKLLWVIRGDQGEWKHGRIILPSYDMEYQVGWQRGRCGDQGILVICISIFQRPCPFIIKGTRLAPLFSLCFSRCHGN